jgi:hypothetical protein
MLAFYLPFLVFDAALDLCAAQREPVMSVMDEKPAIRIAPQ